MTHHIPEEAVAFQGEGSLVISDSNRLVLAEYLQLSCVLILHARFPALYVGLALDGLFISQKCLISKGWRGHSPTLVDLDQGKGDR